MGVFLETYKIMCNFALFNHLSYNSGLKDRFKLNILLWHARIVNSESTITKSQNRH